MHFEANLPIETSHLLIYLKNVNQKRKDCAQSGSSKILYCSIIVLIFDFCPRLFSTTSLTKAHLLEGQLCQQKTGKQENYEKATSKSVH